VSIRRFVGVDLAWAQRTDGRPDNETGLVALDGDGDVVAAGWARGVAATIEWLNSVADPDGTLAFVDASLIVDNPTGQRRCETQVGQRYGRWKVSANTTNMGTPHRAGVVLREALESLGWAYHDGLAGAPTRGLLMSECYPYTTLVGSAELYFADGARPRYKRMPRGMKVAAWRPERAANCDELVRRLAALSAADPPLHLASHPVTRQLLAEPSPLDDRAYKHREDLIDAALAAWTALVWTRHGLARCQILGEQSGVGGTLIAPAMPSQRR
jgi:predicted RNase H-like nuclease